jgi:hypothetical protein
MSEFNELLARREANIARNVQFLEDLGLDAVKPVMTPEVSGSSTKSKKRKIDANKTPVEPERRSSRIKNTPAPNYTEIVSLDELDVKAGRARSRQSNRILDQPFDVSYDDHLSDSDLEEFVTKKRVTPSKPKVKLQEMPPIPIDSSRSMSANVDFFLNSLASNLESPTKAAIMNKAHSSKGGVRFNKYCGVAEWKNSLFLWVNVPEPGVAGDYPNEFREKGKMMSWFGGSRMHAETPVVKRLLKEKDQVLLFMRFTQESYHCLGRLRKTAAMLNMHPVSFVFELIDFDRVKDSTYFKNVLKRMEHKEMKAS